MKIIVLTGKKHTRKTTTLNLVYDQIILSMQNPPPKQKIKNAAANDFECTNLSYNGKSVAIFSMGDTLYRFYEAIFKYSTVDFLIIALNQDGNTKIKLAATIAKYTQHHVVPKTVNNVNDCTKIISLIK